MLPFGYTGLSLVVLPMEHKLTGLSMINKEIALGEWHSGLSKWLVKSEDFWNANKKKSDKSTRYQWLDYAVKLTA